MKHVFDSPLLSDLNAEQDAFVLRAIERGRLFLTKAVAERRIPATASSLIAVREHVMLDETTGILGDVEEISRIFPRSEVNSTEAFAEAVRQTMDALDRWLAGLEDRAAGLIALLVEGALNAACRHVQMQLDVRHGDIAGIFFAGEHSNFMRRYVLAELQALQTAPTAGAPFGSVD